MWLVNASKTKATQASMHLGSLGSLGSLGGISIDILRRELYHYRICSPGNARHWNDGINGIKGEKKTSQNRLDF